MEDVKIIVIGDSKKISPAMMRGLQGAYKCKIEFMSADEFKASGLKAEDVLHTVLVPKPKKDEFFELSKMPSIEVLDPIVEKQKTTKPYNPKTIGKVNSRNMTSMQRFNNKRLKSR